MSVCRYGQVGQFQTPEARVEPSASTLAVSIGDASTFKTMVTTALTQLSYQKDDTSEGALNSDLSQKHLDSLPKLELCSMVAAKVPDTSTEDVYRDI